MSPKCVRSSPRAARQVSSIGGGLAKADTTPKSCRIFSRSTVNKNQKPENAPNEPEMHAQQPSCSPPGVQHRRGFSQS